MDAVTSPRDIIQAMVTNRRRGLLPMIIGDALGGFRRIAVGRNRTARRHRAGVSGNDTLTTRRAGAGEVSRGRGGTAVCGAGHLQRGQDGQGRTRDRVCLRRTCRAW